MLKLKLEDTDILSPETVDFIEAIAKEDNTDFSQAMAGYDLMVIAAHRLAREEDEEPLAIAERILDARLTLGITLGRAVRMMEGGAESNAELPKHGQGKCRAHRCIKPTAVSSYYYCARHQPLQDSDDGALTYHQSREAGVIDPSAPARSVAATKGAALDLAAIDEFLSE